MECAVSGRMDDLVQRGHRCERFGTDTRCVGCRQLSVVADAGSHSEGYLVRLSQKTEKNDGFISSGKRKPNSAPNRCAKWLIRSPLAPSHVGRVADVEQSENDAGNRNDAQQVDFAPRVEEDRCENDGRNGSRCADGCVARVVAVADQVVNRSGDMPPK